MKSVVRTYELQSALESSKIAIRSNLEFSTNMMLSVLDKEPYYDPLILNAYLRMKNIEQLTETELEEVMKLYTSE